MEICTIGGFEQVGKNMTAVKVDEDVFLFDMGLYIPGICELQEEHVLEHTYRLKKGEKGRGVPQRYTEAKLRSYGAIPDDRILDKLGWRKKVRAILIGHAHLDHVGAVPHLAGRYPQATIYATPFTMKVLEAIMEDDRIGIRNKMKVVQPNSTHMIQGKSGTYKVDFIHATHSTIQCVYPVLHTKEGIFFYALDLKFDNYPTLGSPPNYKKLKELGRKGVKVVIADALYAHTETKPGGERIAKHMVEESFSKVKRGKSAFFVTTFASHIERLNNIVNFAQKTGREIVFLGRSLSKYVNAASQVNMCPFKNKVKILKYARQRDAFLEKLEKNRGRYLVVCTGHQAEENSVLDRIVKGSTPFNFKPRDSLIFSSSVIPVPENLLARERMDKKLRKMGVKLQTDIHVHGHGSREDLRDLIELLKPKHIIPAHAPLQRETSLVELSAEYGYKFGETSHLSSNGKVLKF